ncbi:MAG: hypothetical protein ABI858_03255 [Pseudoxanthomonas sp.]
MSRLLLGIVVVTVLLLASIAYVYLIEPYKSLAIEAPRVASVPNAASASKGQQEKGAVAQLGRDRSSTSIPASMSSERAYADAYAILRCAHAADDSLALPQDMTDEQKKQFQNSRVEGLDCSALDSKHSAYDLAKFAAEKGNLQAQLDFPAIAASLFNDETNALDPLLIAKYKQDSLKYLNMAASAGSLDAYARLAENYRIGLFSQKDPIKAYAYAYANSQLNQSEISTRWANQFSNGLSSNELLQAQQLGQRLITRK